MTVSSDKKLDLQEPKLPNLDQFDLLNKWESSSTRSSFGSGGFQTQRSKTFNYVLAPRGAGLKRINSIEIVVAGKAYRTKAHTIRVLPEEDARAQGGSTQRQGRGNPPPPPTNPSQKLPGGAVDPFQRMDRLFSDFFQDRRDRQDRRGQRDRQHGQHRRYGKKNKEDYFLQAEVNKSKVFKGEQLTVALYLYATGMIQDVDTLKHPSNKGFWKEDIEIATRLRFENTFWKGVPYQRALLASYALFPLKAGPAVIDPYEVKAVALESSSGFGFRPAEYRIASPPIEIEVLPLPIENQPSNFSGAVGIFQVKSELSKSQTSVNHPVTLKIRFEGQGNAKLIDLPELSLPPDLEVYDVEKGIQVF